MVLKEITGTIQKKETNIKHEISIYKYIVNDVELSSLNDYELYTGDLVKIKYDETYFDNRLTNNIIEMTNLIEDIEIKEEGIKKENVDFIKTWANVVASESVIKSLMSNDKIHFPSDEFNLEFKKRKNCLLKLINDG